MWCQTTRVSWMIVFSSPWRSNRQEDSYSLSSPYSWPFLSSFSSVLSAQLPQTPARGKPPGRPRSSGFHETCSTTITLLYNGYGLTEAWQRDFLIFEYLIILSCTLAKNSVYVFYFHFKPEGMACHTGQLLAPAEGFVRGFLAPQEKEVPFELFLPSSACSVVTTATFKKEENGNNYISKI